MLETVRGCDVRCALTYCKHVPAVRMITSSEVRGRARVSGCLTYVCASQMLVVSRSSCNVCRFEMVVMLAVVRVLVSELRSDGSQLAACR